MKTNIMSVVSIAGKSLCALTLTAFLVACGDDAKNKITTNSDEPAWVNNIQAAKDYAKSPVVAVGSAKLLDGNLNYATNQATMQARVQIAQTISARVEQAIKEMAQSDGLKISENSLQAAKQKVEATLQKSEMVVRWTDKQTTPPTLYVLVSMDKDAYDQALKGGAQVLNINAEQAQRLSATVEEMLR
ncbi:LPP20 family lipoprotein [Helicobacter trogontum]|nr:LPP20 family lipoprotein [Helicobacter trogontum]